MHVGKCAGVTVRNTLTMNSVSVYEYDMAQADIAGMRRKVIIAVRDPVDRVVSAFNWRHPSNPSIHHNPMVDGQWEQAEHELYECFSTVGEFADALDPALSSRCANVVRRMLTGKKAERGRWSMIGDGVSWYLEPLRSQLLAGDFEFRLTRVESLAEDLEAALA